MDVVDRNSFSGRYWESYYDFFSYIYLHCNLPYQIARVVLWLFRSSDTVINVGKQYFPEAYLQWCGKNHVKNESQSLLILNHQLGLGRASPDQHSWWKQVSLSLNMFDISIYHSVIYNLGENTPVIYIFVCKINTFHLCKGNNIHFQLKNDLLEKVSKVFETENVFTQWGLEPPTFRFMPNALPFELLGPVSEWVIKFNGLFWTTDITVYIVHTSRVIISFTLKPLSSLT